MNGFPLIFIQMAAKRKFEYREALRPIALALAAALLSYGAASLLHANKQHRSPPPPPPVRKHQFTGDIAGYRRDCIDNVLKGGAIPDSCRSIESIKTAYNGLDASEVLDIEQGKMIQTAQWIADGTIDSETTLEECIRNEVCAAVPVPKQGDKSPDNLAKRRLFRHLMEDGRLTREFCAVMDACAAMTRAGLIHWENPTP